MSVWHDILTVPPADGDMIFVRRYPEDTPPLYGQWSLADNGLLLPDVPPRQGPWSLPWTFITYWRHITTPPVPPPPAPPKSWRDTYLYPPNDAQPVWLRRWPGGGAAVAAIYTAADGTFAITPSPGLVLSGPWFCFYQWKPM